MEKVAIIMAGVISILLLFTVIHFIVDMKGKYDND